MGEPNPNLTPIASGLTAGSPAGWFGPPALRAIFGRGREAHKRRLHWLAGLPDTSRRLNCGAWEVNGSALLADGRRVAEAAQDQTFRHIPSEIKRAGRSTRDRDLLLRQAYQRDCALQLARPDLPSSTDRYFAELRRLHRVWAAAHHISLEPKAVMRRRQRLERGEPLDQRFRSGRRPAHRDPELLDKVREVATHPHRFTNGDAYDEQARLAAQLKIAPLSESAVNSYIAKLPALAKAAGRMKPREFEARCIPKMRIDYTDLPAGDWLCLDGRVADVQVRIPDASGGWRATRLTVTGVADVRSTKLTVDVRPSETWVGYLAALRAWASENGLPRRITMDQGEAPRKTARVHAARRIRGVVEEATPRLLSVFDRFEIEVLLATPYHPWAKKIESLWRMLKRLCDRWVASYWGGRPGERPQNSEELVKRHVEELPTAEDFRGFVLMAVETYNAKPRRALGWISPNEMFATFRGTARRIDPEVLDTYFTIADGPRRVGRDGVRYGNILYTLEAEDLVRLCGRDVWILPRLDEPGVIALCDERERLLCYGAQQQLVAAGVKDQHARGASAKAKRVKRLARTYLAERDFLLETPTGQMLREKRDFAVAQEKERAERRPAPTPPDVQIVRPDLVEQVGGAGRKSPFRRLADLVGGVGQDSVRAARGSRRAGFAKLSEQTIDIPVPQRRRVDWSRQTSEGAMEGAESEQPGRRRTADAG